MALPALLVTLIIILSAAPAAAPTVAVFPGFDKLAHLGVYGLLATHLCRILPGRERDFRVGALAIAGTVAFGLIDEFLQRHNPARTFEWLDLAADFAGALLAVTLYQHWTFYHRLLESPLARVAVACRGAIPKDDAHA
jgi:VanZ family protein